MEQSQEFTSLLERHRRGEANLRDQLLCSIYGELKRLAARQMSSERSDHTLQPTALVHEVWLRLSDGNSQAKNKSHYMALAVGVMKEVLIDHARKRKAAKRGGEDRSLVTFRESMDSAPDSDGDGDGDSDGAGASASASELLDLCDLLEKLRRLDPRQAQLVELRVFGGMDFPEIAEALSISLATVKRDWVLARAWLYRELT